jgi:hypothetical protein
MASLAGWYPDPGGAPGQYRYWSGEAWSEALSPTPYAPPPVTAAGDYTTTAYSRLQSTPSTVPLGGTFGASATQNPYLTGQVPPAKKKRPVAPLVTVIAIVVVLGVVAAILVPRLLGGSSTGGETTPPIIDQPTEMTCPEVGTESGDTYAHPNDGWVHGGRLAYPELISSGWSQPQSDNRVPFGRDVMEQSYLLHYNYSGNGSSWVASVLVAELYAGDGFFSPQEGAEIVTRCVLGTFYDDAVVTRNDTRNESYSIDGTDGWIIETTLSFNIPDLPSTSEDVTIIVAATSDMTSSLFYSSVPTDSPSSVYGDVKYVIDSLKVSE